MMEQQRYLLWGADWQGDEPMREQFSIEQMSHVPDERLYYIFWGYDEDGYYQAGFLQGTGDFCSRQDWQVDGGYVSREVSVYRSLYGDAFVEDILRH